MIASDREETKVFERNGFMLEFDEMCAPGKKIKLVGRPESKDTLFGEADVIPFFLSCFFLKKESIRFASWPRWFDRRAASRVCLPFALRACEPCLLREPAE